MANRVYSLTDTGVAETELIESKTVKTEIYSDISMRSVRNNKIPSSCDKNVKQNIVEKLIDVEAVKNAVKNIFTFLPGERVLEPGFGNKLYELLYSPINKFTKEQIALEIKSAFSMWEPRAVLDAIVDLSELADQEDNTVRFKIVWHVDGFETAPQNLYI